MRLREAAKVAERIGGDPPLPFVELLGDIGERVLH